MTAWLRWGEMQATSLDSASYDADRFRQALAEIRPLTHKEPFAQIFKRVQRLCAEAGVLVVLVIGFTAVHSIRLRRHPVGLA